MLPPRTAAAEDAFVAEWAERDDADALTEAIEEAMDARRPMLAARLMNLLGDQVDIEPGSDLDRARRAARMLVMPGATNTEALYNEMDEAWRALREHRMRRMKARMRDALHGRQRRVGRLDGRKKRR